jgi:hypothetical protein
MELAIDIVKSILLPKLEKDANFDNNKVDATFWESFATSLLDFEKNDAPCKTAIYSLELNKPERMIAKLPNIYNLYIKELAENYVLGNESEAIESLLKSKNQVFNEEVRFLNNLEEAITEIEHERIKAILSSANESLVDVSDEKEKEEIQVIKLPEVPIAAVKDELIPAASKVIPLSWIKYAAAACIVLTAGIMYFKFNTDTNLVQPGDTNVVTAPVKKDTTSKGTITAEIPSEALAEVATVTKNAPVIESGLGFASKKNNIKIVENNQKARMVSIVSAIEKYRQLLENEFSENKVGDSSRIKELETKIISLQKELALLKEREKQYVFDGKALILYVSTTSKENIIVLYGDNFYLKRDADYFKLTVAEQPQLYKRESNTEVVSALDKIIFDYGN